MPAFVIVEVAIKDPEAYEAYKKLTPASIAAYKSKFIVIGGNPAALEGDWKPGRLVVLQFPDVEHANQWWNSEEYAPAKVIRQGAATTRMILVEGVENF
jgi:uncharacterized protein (DUF1330 family)